MHHGGTLTSVIYWTTGPSPVPFTCDTATGCLCQASLRSQLYGTWSHPTMYHCCTSLWNSVDMSLLTNYI